MTKQQEIREGVANRVDYYCEGCILADTISCIHPCKQEYLIADKILSYLHPQGVVIRVEGELPKYLYHTVLGMSEVENSTIRDSVKSIMKYGLIPKVPDEWADLLPLWLRLEPVVWLSKGIYQGYQRGRILRIQAGLLNEVRLSKVETTDVDWWVYEGIIPPHLISRVKRESEILQNMAGYVAVEPLIEVK